LNAKADVVLLLVLLVVVVILLQYFISSLFSLNILVDLGFWT